MRTYLQHCFLPPMALGFLGDGSIGKTTAYIFGGAVIFALGLVPSIDIVRKWLQGDRPTSMSMTGQPLMVSPQPVFATMEVVSRVDQELNKKVEKLDKYVHEYVHEQKSEMGSILRQILESEDSNQKGLDEVNKQGEARITGVHVRLNEMDRTIGGLGADTKNANSQLTDVRRTLEVLLSRTAPGQRRGGAAQE